MDAASVELGGGEEDARRYGAALHWDWDNRWFTRGSWYLGGYWEASISHWSGDAGRSGNDDLTEVGLTPVFRYQPHGSESGVVPFVELGIGLHLLSDLALGDKRFGTALNFGEHLGIGGRFGPDGHYEVSYRFQHVSNAGLKKPNAGINFHLLRLTYRY